MSPSGAPSGAPRDDHKAVLRRYLHDARQALVWKVSGLSEQDVRRPRTPTGTSLLGIVKHALNVEAGYFGATFGRDWPIADRLAPMAAYDTDPQADWYATEDESAADVLALYRQVWELADETIEELPLDALGQVPWWPAARRQVTLQQIIVHVLTDLARHAGQADILREQLDGQTGELPSKTTLPADLDWAAYVARLDAIADRFAD